MSSDNQPVEARIPAAFDAPDRVLYGLNARQVAILATVGALLWLTYHALPSSISPVAFAIAALPIGGTATAMALGRRDGISMDRWLTAALVTARSPRWLVAAPAGVPGAPSWAPQVRPGPASRTSLGRRAPAAMVSVSPLRLPAHSIDEAGVVDVDGARIAVTAATTVNFDLRSAAEQHALVDGMGRWLNSLSQPVQIVISTRRVDMYSLAEQIDDRLDALPHPALADAAAGYAQFLRELAADRDPLDRRVLIAHQVRPHTDASVARRAAEQTARALTGLGAATGVLSGGLVTDALVAACDPWRNVGTGRATPNAVVTAEPDGDLP